MEACKGGTPCFSCQSLLLSITIFDDIIEMSSFKRSYGVSVVIC